VVDEHQRAPPVGALTNALDVGPGDQLDRLSRDLGERPFARVRAGGRPAEPGTDLDRADGPPGPGIDEIDVGAGEPAASAARGIEHPVDRLAQLPRFTEELLVALGGACETGLLEPRLQVGRLTEPLGRLLEALGQRGHKLERDVTETPTKRSSAPIGRHEHQYNRCS
jgi:hypothetical protein